MKKLVPLFVLLLAASPALAQEDAPEPPAGTQAMYQTMLGGGYANTMAETAPMMARADLERYWTILNLDAQQREAADALFSAYQEETHAHRRRLLDQWRELRAKMQRTDPKDFNGMAAMRDFFLEAQKKDGEIDAGFLSDLRSILTAEQDQRWADFERTLRRGHRLRFAYISGERPDLVVLVARARGEEGLTPPLEQVLDAYEQELDRAIGLRERTRESAVERSRGMRYDGGEDDGKLIRGLLDEVRAAGLRVRDVNRKYARQIAEILPPPQADAFVEAFERASFPEIYRQTDAERAIAAVLGFADLTAQQREQIEQAAKKLEEDIGLLNVTMARATEQAEENFTPGDMAGDKYGLKDGAARKKERSQAALKELKGILTPAQRERLPEPQQP